MTYVILIIAIVCIMFSTISLLLFGLEKKVFAGIQTEPPRGLNPLEMAMIYNKKALPGDALSLLHYLASKDYLSITKSPDGSQTVLTKLKNYDGDNAAEKFIFDSIFIKNPITINEIQIHPGFFGCFRIAAKAVNSASFRYKYFDELSLKIRKVSKIVNTIGLILVTFILCIDSGIDKAITLASMLCLFQVTALFILGSGNEVEIGYGSNRAVKRGNNRILFNLAICVFLMLFTGIIAIGIVSFGHKIMNKTQILYISIVYICCLLVLCLSQLIATFIDRRTNAGINAYQEIVNFKKYLDTTERPMVEKLFVENHQAFRKVISYGFILGISSKWVKDFDVIVFDSVYSTVYGGTVNNSKIGQNELLLQQQNLLLMQKIYNEYPIDFNARVNEFNNMIDSQDLKLFNTIYKEHIK